MDQERGSENLVLTRDGKLHITAGIVTYNNAASIGRCLASIQQVVSDAEGYDFQLYVYDNASTDETLDLVQKFEPFVTLIRGKKNLGFGRAHNEILNRVSSDVHFVVNPDIQMFSDVFRPLAEQLLRDPGIGLITPKVLNRDGTEQYLPKYCPSIRYSLIGNLPGFGYIRRRYTRQSHNFLHPEDIQFCTGCFFGARTETLRSVGGFSPEFFLYLEDTDLSRKILAKKKRIVFDPACSVTHDWHRENAHSLRGLFRFLRSLFIYFRKWGWKF